jgi:energy-converting hydrogenase Eha subunit H
MSCCNTTKEQFLIQKGKNFKEFILKYKPDADVLQYMEKFNETNILSSIITLLVPIKLTGNEVAVNELLSKLTIPANEVAQVKDKVQRYFEMFIAIATD